MINLELLNRIELADIACTRAHFAQLTDTELAEREYRSCDMDGVWVYAETRNRERVGHISGFGVASPSDVEALSAAFDWLRSENAKSIRVKLVTKTEHEPIAAWLKDAGLKPAIQIHQWYTHTNVTPIPKPATRRRIVNQQIPPFVIREIGPEHAEAFARIVAVNYRFKPGADLAWLERQVSAPGRTAFLAFVEDEPVGTGLLCSAEGDNTSVLGYGITMKAYRNRGLQNAMIAARVQKSRELGYDLATASTFGTDRSSRNLRRQGFALGGVVAMYRGPAASS